ncbi:MAG TPA: Kazal-type serine protease inhibitor [Candidatus Pacearchaeota archaeon]|nr:Kazal-type serine protease inhibitor [Candidatus Pacearchaeota archaeon]HQG09252.1 Kazal-type serine protease inhibitor [Candidatus Pacearchaeota archaeon]HQH20319.1 Kazal-type serine protease inhibitor [Candidatus Pacearchaeota archaeon]HQK58585.1 Kazal-type serine protease inhibitor [Candidatus Pacearchaeota archaeon]HRR95073.1 Kazal-type serine protease inhibitor [Candidatus Paceibacterota bacterium]
MSLLKNKFFIVINFLCLLCLTVSFCLAKEEAVPIVEIITPQEGQTLIVRNQYKIVWNYNYKGEMWGDATLSLIENLGSSNNLTSNRVCNLGAAPLSQKEFILTAEALKNCQNILKNKGIYTISLQYRGYYVPLQRYINLSAQKNIIIRFETNDVCGTIAIDNQNFEKILPSALCQYGELTSSFSAYDEGVFDGNWHWACENVKCSAIDPNNELKKSFQALQLISYSGDSQNPNTLEYITQGHCAAFNIPTGYILSSCEEKGYNQIFNGEVIKVILRKPEPCPQDYAPVCGKNNKTYINECFAKKENIEPAYTGSCSLKIDGVCGASNGKSFRERPSVNLCKAGIASAVSKYAPWTWTCKGINGGADAQCSAQEIVSKPLPSNSSSTIKSLNNNSLKPLTEMSRAELLAYLYQLLAALQSK